MRYSIILLVVVGLIGNCLLTKLIHGAHTFTGPKALPWERNICGSPFECLGLALIVVLLFGNIHGQRNIRPTTTARIKPTTLAPTTPARVCSAGYSLYSEKCGQFCYRYDSSMCGDWSEARRVCQNEGGDLLVPSECNFQFFRDLAIGESGTCAAFIWLGARRPTGGGNFRTVGGEEILNNANFWGLDKPDNINGDENCLEIGISDDFMANDELCTRQNGHICQKMLM